MSVLREIRGTVTWDAIQKCLEGLESHYENRSFSNLKSAKYDDARYYLGHAMGISLALSALAKKVYSDAEEKDG